MSTRDPRMAFRCNSGCFGDMVTPVAQVVRSVEWSDEHQQWICRLGGPGDPVLYCREKHVLESMLDDLENRNALNKTGRIGWVAAAEEVDRVATAWEAAAEGAERSI